MCHYSATTRLSSNEPFTPSPVLSFGRRQSIASSTFSAQEPSLSGTSSVVSPSQPQTPVTNLPFSRDLFGTQLMSKLQAVPPKRHTNQVYNVVNPKNQLQLYSGGSQAGIYLDGNAQHSQHFVFAPENEHAVLSHIKSEAQPSPSSYPNGLPGSSFDLGFRTAPSSFENTWGNYSNGLYGRSFDSGVDTAASSFAAGWFDPELAFAGAEHSFSVPNSSPQLVDFPTSQSSVLAGTELTMWAPQPRTHVAPSDTHVDWDSSLDIRLQMRSDNFDKTIESPDITMGMYESFDQGLVDVPTDLSLLSTQAQVGKNSDTESDEKPKKSAQRSTKQPKSRSKHGGRVMQSGADLRKPKRPAPRQSGTRYDRAGRPVRVSIISSNGAHRCHFEKCKGQSFQRSEHLKRHLNTTHGGKAPFTCPIPGCQEKPSNSKRPKGSGSNGTEGPTAFNRSDNRYAHIVRHIEKSTGSPRVQPTHSFEKLCSLIRCSDTVEKLKRGKAYGKICAAAGIKCKGDLCDGEHCSKRPAKEKPLPCYQGDACSVTKRNILELELERLKEVNRA